MKQDELITIGLTCYNAEETILRALNSAINQTWKKKEIIIVDDCSTDNSVSILNKQIKLHPDEKIIVIQHKNNQGPAAARQTILDNSNGSFIAFFDDDDESYPQRLESQYHRIVNYEKNEDKDLIACYASGKRIYPNGYTVTLRAIGSQPPLPNGVSVAKRLLYFGGDQSFFYGTGTPSCSLMARKKTFQHVGGFDPGFRRVEDIDFAIRLALLNGVFIGCPEPLFVQYATAAIDKSPEKNRDAELKLVEKHKKFLESAGRYNYAKQWPLLRYYHFKKNYIKLLLVLLKLFMRYPIKAPKHFINTAPKRLIHELKMKKETQ